MNLLLTIPASLVAFVVDFIAWYLAGRRQHTVQRLEMLKGMGYAWAEGLLPFVGIGGFILVPTWLEKSIVAMAAATGGALGIGVAMWIEKRRRKQ